MVGVVVVEVEQSSSVVVISDGSSIKGKRGYFTYIVSGGPVTLQCVARPLQLSKKSSQCRNSKLMDQDTVLKHSVKLFDWTSAQSF